MNLKHSSKNWKKKQIYGPPNPPSPTSMNIRNINIKSVCIITILSIFLSGCVTEQQVSDIVAESNRLSLAPLGEQGDALISGGAPAPGANNGTEPWEAAAARIDRFVLEHPDDKVTNNSLRIRQAIIYLTHQKFNLAQAAFNQIEGSPVNDRDNAIYELHKEIIWWFRNSSQSFDGKNVEVNNKLKTFRKTINSLHNESIEIKLYLTEMQMWISLKLCSYLLDPNDIIATANTGINLYAKLFTDEEIRAYENVDDYFSNLDEFKLNDVRRVSRLSTNIGGIRKILGKLVDELIVAELSPQELQTLKTQIKFGDHSTVILFPN